MSESNDVRLLKANLKQLRLPTLSAECEKLAREAATGQQSYEQYLLRLTELEVATRASNALAARIKQAAFGVFKDFDTFDFSALPSLNKQKILELARGEWIDQHYNCCLIGTVGTGKTHVATALGLAACRQGRKVRFFAAGNLVTRLEEAPEAIPARPLPHSARQGRPAHLRRARLPVFQSYGCGAALPALCRPLRAGQPADHQQPGLQRLGPGLPGRTHDRRPARPADPPLPHLRDERRKLPLSRVHEDEERKEKPMTAVPSSATGPGRNTAHEAVCAAPGETHSVGSPRPPPWASFPSPARGALSRRWTSLFKCATTGYSLHPGESLLLADPGPFSLPITI